MRVKLLVLSLFSALLAPSVGTADVGQHLAPMTFTVQRDAACPTAGCVIASGWIGPGTAADFGRFAKSAGLAPGAEVRLRSGGGDVMGALKLGLLMRRLGMDTRVQAESGTPEAGLCASSCAYVFLGGVRRRVDEGARLGVHQFWPSMQAPDPSQTQRVVGLIASYLEAVGADPKVQRLALLTPPDRMHWLSSRELTDLGVVTGPSLMAQIDG